MVNRIFTTLVIFSLGKILTFGQVIEPDYTFNVELGLPNSFVNKPFKDIMQGLVSVEPYLEYHFKSNLTTGVGLRYSYFAVNEFKVPIPVYGGMHSGGAFIKVGWNKFHNPRFATDVAIKVGYTQNYFVTDRNDTLNQNPYQVNAAFVEPTIGFILTADEVSSYRFFISYGFQGFRFRPEMIGLETLAGYDKREYERGSSFLVVGFGYTYYFNQQKSTE